MSEPSDAANPGRAELNGVIGGKYAIVRLLGKGAMGQVYLAHDQVLDRDVALKVMAHQISDDPELKARFEREARAAAKLTHPNVVTVFDLGTHTDSSPYIAMEFLRGKDLQKAVRQQGGMTLERKVSVIVQVLAGLAHAHRAGIVHRDIKPANVYILEDDKGALSGPVKILDFGVARVAAASMTGTGNIVGTADYMSPEQVKGDKVDGRSDIFSVGCLLYELVTGRRPFHSDNLMAIFYKITHDPPNFDLVPSGPEYDALLPILKKALDRSLEERYQTAYAFAVDLREWLRSHATTDSSQQVIEALVDLEAPTHIPEPMTEAPGATVVPVEGRELGGATVDLGPGRRAPGRGTLGATRMPARAVAGGAVARGGVRGATTAPPISRPRARRAPERRSALPWVLLSVVVAGAAVGGYLYWQSSSQPAPPVTLAAAPEATAPPPTTLATPTPPPVTAAPQPRFEEAAGKAAASVHAAQAAFRKGDYDRAVAAAQQALREDADNAQAKDVLSRALDGQKAAARVVAGEAALQRGDFDTAEREARAALALAAWDTRAADLRSRIDAARLRAQQEAQAQAQTRRAARVNGLLNGATDALAAKRYDDAIAAYDQVLTLDPGNVVAQTGKTNAITARQVAEMSTGGGGAATAAPAHAFVMGASVAKGSQASSGDIPSGFDSSPEVNVKRGSQAAALPAKLLLEATPPAPKPGDRYSVSAYLLNEGSQAIELERLVVTTTIDGRKQQGPVRPAASVAAPRQKTLVFQLPGQVWKDDTTSWSMEIVLWTSNRESYRNSLTWK